MTTLLFLELHQEVLQLLTKKDLKTLSLVSSDFQRLAQSLLFREIQFNLANPGSWDFLNSERGRELCSVTQCLHMFRASHDWSLPHNYTTDGLTDFMRAFASLRTLSCNMIRPELGTPPLPFWPSIMASVCPHIETLSLYAMEVPLWDILAQSPLLKRLKLGFVVTSEPSTPTSRIILPGITELDLGDLSAMTGSTDRLWRLFSSMSSLHTLKVDTDHNSRIISLDFMPLSKPNLRTISFGVQFYDWVVPKKPYYYHYRLIHQPHSTRGQLDLNGLLSLERLSFTIRFPPNNVQWVVWLTWLALLVQRPLPTSLNDLEIHFDLGREDILENCQKIETPVKEFDALAGKSSVGILFIIHTDKFEIPERNTGVEENYEAAVMLVERTMPLWCSTGKMKIIRGDVRYYIS